MSAARRKRVVVDGSNLATEGRTDPSLTQLDEAVRAFIDENSGVEIIVVADASFAHRVEPGERKRLAESELAGEIVTPPAGAVGRGDAFILKIADRINGVVLSNDSFQEFHNEYPWLFDEGRLIGGKPVPGVGWIFTARIPVRGAKSPRPVKKLAVALPGGQKPTIGTTLTPVKKAVAKKALEKTPEKAPEKTPEKTPVKRAPARKALEKTPEKASPKETKTHVKKTAAKATVKKTPAKAPAKKVPAKAPAPRSPAVALRRGRHPVNPEADFALFRATYKVGARVEGEVSTFTSHGAVIKVELRGDRHVECYAPTTLLGTPAPARARDVLERGDRRIFRLVNVDAERRIAELALP